MQLAELREHAGRRGWQIVEEFTDQGVSGCKESRPALNRLMADKLIDREVRVVVLILSKRARMSLATGTVPSKQTGGTT
jgi:site-specific DNA recombinase